MTVGTLPRSVLADQVKERLLEEILSGRYRPDERIVETQVPRDLGTSQVTDPVPHVDRRGELEVGRRIHRATDLSAHASLGADDAHSEHVGCRRHGREATPHRSHPP